MKHTETLYHSVLSRCAELLDNMKEGDPITEVPEFLAAKLKQLQTPVTSAMPPLPEPDHALDCGMQPFYRPDQMYSFARSAIAAHLASQSQAAQTATALRNSLFPGPSIAEVLEAKDHEIAALRSHLAGQSQATRAVPEGWRKAMRDLVRVLRGVECGDDGQWKFIANVCANAEELLAAPTAQEVTPPRPTDDDLWDATLRDRDAYHEWADKLAEAIAKYFCADIGEHSNMNCPWHEALEVIENATAPAQEVTQQAAPAGHVVDIDRNCNESIINVALEPGTEIYLAPVTQQAAKAETAEQAWISVDDDSRKPEVGRPILMFVRTEMHGEDDEGHSFTTEGEEVAMGEYRKSPSYDVHYFDCYTSPMSDNDWITHWMPLPPAPDQTQPAGAARQGGNTSKENGSDLVPTTSTVSAPEEVQDRDLLNALDAWVEQNKAAGFHNFHFAFNTESSARAQLDADPDIRALRTTSGKGEAA